MPQLHAVQGRPMGLGIGHGIGCGVGSRARCDVEDRSGQVVGASVGRADGAGERRGVWDVVVNGVGCCVGVGASARGRGANGFGSGFGRAVERGVRPRSGRNAEHGCGQNVQDGSGQVAGASVGRAVGERRGVGGVAGPSVGERRGVGDASTAWVAASTHGNGDGSNRARQGEAVPHAASPVRQEQPLESVALVGHKLLSHNPPPELPDPADRPLSAPGAGAALVAQGAAVLRPEPLSAGAVPVVSECDEQRLRDLQNRAACSEDSDGCHTCRERVDWIVKNNRRTLEVAYSIVAAEFPEDCSELMKCKKDLLEQAAAPKPQQAWAARGGGAGPPAFGAVLLKAAAAAAAAALAAAALVARRAGRRGCAPTEADEEALAAVPLRGGTAE
ncbi:unnamed protein product [Prorocentrum cordatum]|uniref:Saposin B-type domain-containing protein n=1 Tax=Prorocentrum cordatum TaxID=2364126 RepID=A0ABN9SPN5_9DINO|nr:unnamed protein product [Polarella glacialis]